MWAPLPERDRPTSGQIRLAARVEICGGVLLPACLVKISGEKEARFVQHHRIDAHHKVAARIVPARKMPADDVIGNRKEAAVRAFRTLDPRLFANALNPLIRASRRVAGLTGFAAFETAGVDILTPTEQ